MSDPRYEFQDREIQEASRSVVELAQILENKVSQYSYPHDHVPNCQTTLTYADERTGVVQPQTLENIKQLNDTAHQLVAAIDELIRIGRRKIPST